MWVSVENTTSAAGMTIFMYFCNSGKEAGQNFQKLWESFEVNKNFIANVGKMWYCSFDSPKFGQIARCRLSKWSFPIRKFVSFSAFFFWGKIKGKPKSAKQSKKGSEKTKNEEIEEAKLNRIKKKACQFGPVYNFFFSFLLFSFVSPLISSALLFAHLFVPLTSLLLTFLFLHLWLSLSPLLLIFFSPWFFPSP